MDPISQSIWRRYLSSGDLQTLQGELLTTPDWLRPQETEHSLLLQAVLARDLPAVSMLLSSGEVPNLPASDGFTILHQAVDSLKDALDGPEAADALAILRELLRHGADPNRSGADGATALHRAVGHGLVRAAKILMEHGANVELRMLVDDEPTPLTIARMTEQPEMVQLLSRAGAAGARDA